MLDTILSLLSTSTMLFTTASSASVLRTAAQLHEVVALLHHLLPAVPDASAMVLEGLPALPSPSAAAAADPRTAFLLEQPPLVKKLCLDLLPLLLQVHSATVMPQVCDRSQGLRRAEPGNFGSASYAHDCEEDNS